MTQILPEAKTAQNTQPPANVSPLMKVTVVIPAYNEARFIGSVVIQSLRYFSNVLVIDDGSDDETAYIAKQAGAQVIRHETNQGKSQAVNTALEWARRNMVDALVFLDGDGQHNPDEINAVLAPVLENRADLVVGSRFMSIKSKIPIYRRFGQHALTAATNLASNVTISDSQSGFRSFSRRAIELLHFRGTGLSVESEMQFLVKEHALTILEVPISVVYEEKAKRNPFAHGVQIVSNIAGLIGQNRPLFFFGVPGLISLVMGIIWSLIILDIYSRSHELAIGYALIDVMLIILGTLSIFVGLILHSVRAFFLDMKKIVLRQGAPLHHKNEKETKL